MSFQPQTTQINPSSTQICFSNLKPSNQTPLQIKCDFANSDHLDDILFNSNALNVHNMQSTTSNHIFLNSNGLNTFRYAQIHSTNSNHNSIASNMHSSITSTQINNIQPPSVHLCTDNAPNLQHHQSSASAPQKLLQNTKTFQDPLLNQQAIKYLSLELAWVHNLLKHTQIRDHIA
jgi:hypothetical protein